MGWVGDALETRSKGAAGEHSSPLHAFMLSVFCPGSRACGTAR